MLKNNYLSIGSEDKILQIDSFHNVFKKVIIAMGIDCKLVL